VPNAEASHVLVAKYKLWRDVYERLRTLYPKLSRIG
jgi:hypothetical protein